MITGAIRHEIPCRILLGTLVSVLLPCHLALASETDKPSAALAPAPLSTANLIETLLGLAFVLAVMLLIAWLVKRFMQVPGINKGQVQVLGGVSLGAREKAVLLAVDGRRLLVGVAPGRVQTLAELGPEEGAATFARELEDATSEAARRRK
jgi:flagellar protein FliO/FliZ